MRTLYLKETTQVSGGNWDKLSENDQITSGIAFTSGAILGLAGASLLSSALASGLCASLAIKGAGLYLGLELGGAIWESNHNLPYYNSL